jgi:membrane protease YdiL (CAAX protease family)
MLAAGLSVAVAGGVGTVMLFFLFRKRNGSLFAAAKPQGSAWNGMSVLVAVFAVLAFGLGSMVVQALLIASGFYRALYGADFPLEMSSDPTLEEKAASTIRYLWATTFAFPLQLAVIWWLPRYLGVRNPFHSRGWPTAAMAGYLTWLIITPAAFCVFVLASLTHMKLTGRGPEKHPLTALGDTARTLEWGLLVLQTVLIAPILEEWFFRGILLPWLAQKKPVPPDAVITVQPRHRPLLVLLAAVGIAILFTLGTDLLGHPDEVRRVFASDHAAAFALYLIPALFFLVLIPVDFLLPRLRRLRRHMRIRSPQHLRAIWASSVMFAAVHSHVWPSPIPLVVLALGLGYLYMRTRSLVGCVLVHGMFNAVSAVYLLLGGSS